MADSINGQATQTLKRACHLLLRRLVALEERVGEDLEGSWPQYLETAKVLASLLPHTQPGAHGEMLTTAQMAQRLSVSPKTLLKWRKTGKVHPAQQNGARGRAALRWQP